MKPDSSNLDPWGLEVVPLDASHLASVIQIAEILEEAPHWPLDSWVELTGRVPSVRRIALVARDSAPAGPGIAPEIEHEIAGFVIARLLPPEAELESIGVAMQWQRRGIGRRLVVALVGELENAGVEKLHLEVRTSNGIAIAFYLSLGFTETGHRPRYYADPVEDAVLMELRLR
jgi:[ribosomal protein S18]-alanine N-acetyltransferase